MKQLAQKYFLFYILFTGVVNIGMAQESPILVSFIGKPIEEAILLQWTINSGQSCNGTTIERSVDSIQFEPVGEIPGICGNSESPVPYNFRDNSPVANRMNYFRLELGGQGYSQVIAIPYFEYGSGGSIVIPNPASSNTTVYCENSTDIKRTLSLFNSRGEKILETISNSGAFNLKLEKLKPGIYIYSIAQPQRKSFTGKIIVR